MTWTVKWEPKWSRDLDFLLPFEGSGQKEFDTEREANEFVTKLQQSGIKLSPRAGHEVFGHELEITISAASIYIGG